MGGNRARSSWEQTQGQTQSQTQHKQRPQVPTLAPPHTQARCTVICTRIKYIYSACVICFYVCIVYGSKTYTVIIGTVILLVYGLQKDVRKVSSYSPLPLGFRDYSFSFNYSDEYGHSSNHLINSMKFKARHTYYFLIKLYSPNVFSHQVFIRVATPSGRCHCRWPP